MKTLDEIQEEVGEESYTKLRRRAEIAFMECKFSALTHQDYMLHAINQYYEIYCRKEKK